VAVILGWCTSALAVCPEDSKILSRFIEFSTRVGNCDSNVYHSGGKIAYHAPSKNWYFDNGRIAYQNSAKNWYYDSGKIAYHAPSKNWYFGNGRVAYQKSSNNWYYDSGKLAYHAPSKNWYFEEGRIAFHKSSNNWYHESGRIAYHYPSRSIYSEDGRNLGRVGLLAPIDAVEFILDVRCSVGFTVFCAVAYFDDTEPPASECPEYTSVLRNFIALETPIGNCDSNFYHSGNTLAFHSPSGNWYHSNSKIAFHFSSKNWYHSNGKIAYHASSNGLYYDDGRLAGKRNDLSPLDAVEFIQNEPCNQNYSMFCVIAEIF